MTRRSATRMATILALTLTLGACGSDAGDEEAVSPGQSGSTGATAGTGSTAPSFPVTVTGSNGELTIDAQPVRVVSLSPTATEDLFAIGAGEQVIAVDDRSNFPPEAPATTLSGYEPNIEAIAGYEPDLVVFATEPGDLGSALEGLGIPALQLDAAASLPDVYAQIETLGAATGHVEEAATLTRQMRSAVEELVAGADPASGLTFYYELDDTYYSITSDTFIGQLFDELGLENIADGAAKGSGGYPQLSGEYILESDPDLIFLADTICCGQDAATVAARSGWRELTAVREGSVIELDDDVASRWGPRVVDLLRQIADAATAVMETRAA